MADGFDFSPLSDDERDAAAQAQANGGEPGPPKPTCPSVDAEPPEVAAARLLRRPPDALWRYRTAEGATAFCVCRWNKPDDGKEIRPLSWSEGEGWRFGAWPDGRPLYNFERIAANPDAPVVVCEGEKAADAAARIFPKSIVTTSSGGAKAAAKTDWSPLAGRCVLIWPDDDEPGLEYAREVAAILAELDCEVSILDAAALVAQVAEVNAPEAKAESTIAVKKKAAGYDAADALADYPDLAELRKLAASLAKRFDPGPAYHSFGVYTMDARGLTIEVEKGKGDNKTIEALRIAAPFEVLGACRDPHGADWGKVLRWRDDDGRQHVRHVGDADLHGEPAVLCGSLARLGLWINRERQRQLVGYLSGLRASRRVTLVPRTGWHEIGGRSVFVLQSETIGLRGGERVILDAAAHGAHEARGSIEEWRDGAAKLARGHVLPVLAISAALAGPLLDLAGLEGGGVQPAMAHCESRGRGACS